MINFLNQLQNMLDFSKHLEFFGSTGIELG